MSDGATVHVIDDDEGIRGMLAYLLASAGFATRVYPTAEAFLQQEPATGAADCVVTDVRLPGASGLDLVKRLRTDGAPHPVVVMSGVADIDMAVEAMKAGAADFLQKPFRSGDMLQAVREAIERDGRRSAAAQEATAYLKMLALLSPRQRDVLDGILAGKLNKTIAHELGISVRTVEGYRLEVMAKTRARSLSELVRIAVLAGL